MPKAKAVREPSYTKQHPGELIAVHGGPIDGHKVRHWPEWPLTRLPIWSGDKLHLYELATANGQARYEYKGITGEMK